MFPYSGSSLGPDSSTATTTGRGRVFLRIGEKERASRDLDWILAKDPDQSEARRLKDGL
jgi:hypothetical protein